MAGCPVLAMLISPACFSGELISLLFDEVTDTVDFSSALHIRFSTSNSIARLVVDPVLNFILPLLPSYCYWKMAENNIGLSNVFSLTKNLSNVYAICIYLIDY
jgi:hypothetical protein